MNQTYNDDQRYLQQIAQNQGLAPIPTPQPVTPSATGGFINWVKANPWWTVIIIVIIILLLWWFCFRKKSPASEVTITPPTRTGKVTVSRIRGNMI